MSLDDFEIIAPLAYQGKVGCEDPRCTRMIHRNEDGTFTMGACMGWHCEYCDEPCGSQGHSCETAKAMLEAAHKIAEEGR